jgi:hypothetical protein
VVASPWSWSKGTRPGLKGFLGNVAPAARHPLYDLYRLALLILGYVADVDEALIAAVRCLLGENLGGFCAYTWCVHSSSPFLWAGSRGVTAPPGPFICLPILYHLCCCVSSYAV